jgi:ribonuclease HI
MVKPGVVTIYTDGASRGNPGPAAYAYVISGIGVGEDDVEEGACLGRMTNNQAEYTALVKGLEHALELAPDAAIQVHSDSELMVKQMRGEYRVKNEELRPLYEQATRLLGRFKAGVTFKHVRRGENKRADELCNQALDGKLELSARELLARHAARATSPAPAARSAPAATPAPKPVKKPLTPVREQALTCLRKASAAWAAGKAGPSAEMVWGELQRLLRENGVEMPDERGGKSSRNEEEE